MRAVAARHGGDEVQRIYPVVEAQGVVFERQRGSHLFVKFDGKTSVVPNHGSKEIPEPLRKKIRKDLGL